MREEPEDTESIIRADHDDVTTGQGFAVPTRCERRPAKIAAAVDPEHYRLRFFRDRPFGVPHVEIEAVLLCLARRACGRRIAHARPWLNRLRLAPAQVTH